MNKQIPSTIVALLASAHLAAADTNKDRYEKGGWTKIQSLEPASATKEIGSQKPIPLVVIENPGITLPKHLVAGEVRYTDVKGTGFVEMWTVYDNDHRYFSRTMGEFGPMAKLSGSSEWSQVTLPFHGNKGEFPSRLELNVVLPGGGEVEFRDLALYQSEKMGGTGGWSNSGTLNKIFAIGGMTIGILGGICGILSGMGKYRRFVQGFLITLLIAGQCFAIGGCVALALGKPRDLWMPMLTAGGVLTLAGGLCFRVVQRTYTEHELRSISAAG